MKISAAKAILTEQDILSIIEDYVHIEGLEINSIEIKELITVRGSYKKRIKIPFEVKLGLGNIKGNIINVKILKINVSKIGIIKSIKNVALKKLLSDFADLGVDVDKDNVAVNLEEVSMLVPYFYFTLNRINIIEGGIEVEAENVIYAETKKMIQMKKSCELSPIRTQGEYSRVRDKIVEKVPEKYEKAVQYAMLIPDITVLLWRLFRDKRVKIKVKMMVGGVIMYLASPIDILPDFIPLIGRIDDVAIAFFGLNAIINEIPEEIILENWQGEENIILLTKEAVNYISKLVGTYNVNKFFEVTKIIFKKGHENYKLAAKKQQLESDMYNLECKEAITLNEDGHHIH